MSACITIFPEFDNSETVAQIFTNSMATQVRLSVYNTGFATQNSLHRVDGVESHAGGQIAYISIRDAGPTCMA